MSAQYELAELQREVDTWFHGTAQDLTQMHASLSTHLRQAEAALQKVKSNLNGGRDLAPMTVTAANDTAAAATATATSASAAMASHNAGLSVAAAPFNFAAVSGANSAAISTKATPMRPAAFATADTTPGMASPPVSHALDYDDLISEVEREVASENAAQTTTGALLGLGGGAQIPASVSAGLNLSAAPFAAPSARPAGTEFTPTSLPAAPITGSAGAASGETISGPCHVLVEFKRQRVLQFESNSYVAPGEFVVVAGDRGEDIGLVTYAWSVSSAPPEHVGKWSGVGVGQVTRVATPLEVSQLQGVQAELEARARDVAQQKVAEHGLPMRIVDAEYQFDRKKLTFYYQSQHRLDFRNLVRDLYKTFRARIWMELD